MLDIMNSTVRSLEAASTGADQQILKAMDATLDMLTNNLGMMTGSSTFA